MERLQVVGYSSCRTKVLLASSEDDGEMFWVSAAGLVRMLGQEGLLPERRSRTAPPPAPARSASSASSASAPLRAEEAPVRVPELTALPTPPAMAPGDEPTGEFPEFDNLLDAWAGFVRRKGA